LPPGPPTGLCPDPPGDLGGPLDPRPSVVIPDSSVVQKQNENPDINN